LVWIETNNPTAGWRSDKFGQQNCANLRKLDAMADTVNGGNRAIYHRNSAFFALIRAI
jgi:hypothetical protein